MGRTKAAIALVAVLAAPAATAGWTSVRVTLQEPDGTTREVSGTALSYGYYVREFTPKGVRDRLRVEKLLPFHDRDIRFPDLARIEFDLAQDGAAGLLVPTVMHITYTKKRDEVVTLDRGVSELRGHGNPRPVLLIVESGTERVELDLTPGHDDEARGRYRPIVRVVFE
jgi:hypothetical protein